MITAGIDCGAKNTKTIIMKEGRIIGKGTVLTGGDQAKAVKASVENACKDAGITEGELHRLRSTLLG